MLILKFSISWIRASCLLRCKSRLCKKGHVSGS